MLVNRWKAVLQVAATYIGTVVGAGFASGQEILQFFTVHGVYGIWAVLISTGLFIWLGCKMMILSQRQECFSYQELNQYLFGKSLGWLFNGLTLVILFGTTGVMLSGTGAIFVEQFNLPFQAGIIGTALLTLLVMYRGMSGVLLVNSAVVPMMLLFTVILGWNLHGVDFTKVFPTFKSQMSWYTAPFLYAAFNLAMAQAVLGPMGKEVGDLRVIRWGGLLGGAGLGVMLLVSHFSLLNDFEQVRELHIPMAEIISDFGKPITFLFSLVVFGEIFTTIIGNVFGLARQLESAFRIPLLPAAFAVLLGSYLLSQWGFQSLVSRLYPLFGYIGLLFIFRIALHRR